MEARAVHARPMPNRRTPAWPSWSRKVTRASAHQGASEFDASPKTSGAPGRFAVKIAQEAGAVTEEVGAIVQATGFTTYDIAKLPELGGGKRRTWSTRPASKRWRKRPTAAPIKRRPTARK